MGIQSENDDFVAFRDSHDAEALARVFDAVAPRMLLLAAHLTPDAAQAEDLVQATFLRGMTKAADYDGERAVSAWLAGILRHCALDARRRGAVRQTEALSDEMLNDEVAAKSGLGGDVWKQASESELFESVSAAIDALESPYREVLVLRIVHGLEPTEIAHSLGRRPGSVRMQLKRGLERLRRDMPQFASAFALGFGDSARGLDAVREVLVAKASAMTTAASTASIAGTQVTASTSISGILGGLLVMKTVWTIVAASVLGIGALWFVNGDEQLGSVSPTNSAQSNREVSAATQRIDTDLGASKRVALPAEEESREREQAPSSSDETVLPIDLRVRVRYRSDGSDAADVGLYLHSADRFDFDNEQRTNDTGVVTFHDVGSGPFEVHVDRLPEPIQIASGSTTTDIWIPIGLRIEGQVVDLDGRGVANATVYRRNAGHRDMLQEIARTGPGGEFELRDADSTENYLARAENHQPSELTWVQGHDDLKLHLVLGARGHELLGQVIGLDGEPVPFAQIAVGVDEDARENQSGSTRTPGDGLSRKPLERQAILLRANENGVFESNQIPGGHAVVFARPPLDSNTPSVHAIGVEELWLGPGTTAPIIVQLETGAQVHGVLRDANGKPVSGISIESSWEGTQQLGELEDELGPDFVVQSTITGHDGAFVLGGLLEGEHDLEITLNGRTALEEERFWVARNSSHEWKPVIAATSKLTIRLLDHAGSPLSNWGVTASRLARFGEQELDRTDSSGVLKLDSLVPNRPVELYFFAPLSDGSLHQLIAASRHAIYPQSDVLDVRLNLDEVPTASVTGQWLEQNGEPVAASGIKLVTANGHWDYTVVTDKQGRFDFPSLSAGEYTLRVGRSNDPVGMFITTVSIAPSEHKDIGQVVLEGSTKLIVSVQADGVDDPSLAWFRVVPVAPGSKAIGAKWTQSGPVWTSTIIPPGVYDLIVRGPDCAPNFERIVVGNDPELLITVNRKRGHLLSAEILLPVAEREIAILTIGVWDSRGTAILDTGMLSSIDSEDDPRMTWDDRFLPGSYRLEVYEPRSPGNVQKFNFTVSDRDQAIEISLR